MFISFKMKCLFAFSLLFMFSQLSCTRTIFCTSVLASWKPIWSRCRDALAMRKEAVPLEKPLLPPQLSPSPCRLFWIDEVTESFEAGSWGVSSWVGRNAEQRSVSRACSFSREFCRQKQNIGLASVQEDDNEARLPFLEAVRAVCRKSQCAWSQLRKGALTAQRHILLVHPHAFNRPGWPKGRIISPVKHYSF